MTTIFLGSPISALQHAHCLDQPTLLSFAHYRKRSDWVQWVPSFGSVLLDSGAFSEMNTGAVIDGGEYLAWVDMFSDCSHLVAWAGLDDIEGDIHRSMSNYAKYGGFPTYHPGSDPPEALPDLIGLAHEQGQGWIGVGVVPPRSGKRRILEEAAECLRDSDLHVHGWALTAYADLYDSVDSTYWFRESHRILRDFNQYLITPAEALEIMVRKIQRQSRVVHSDKDNQMKLNMGKASPDSENERRRKYWECER